MPIKIFTTKYTKHTKLLLNKKEKINYADGNQENVRHLKKRLWFFVICGFVFFVCFVVNSLSFFG